MAESLRLYGVTQQQVLRSLRSHQDDCIEQVLRSLRSHQDDPLSVPRLGQMTSIRTRATAFAIFDTAVGTCGIAWSDRGVAGTQLPEHDVSATRARLQQRFPNATETEPTSEIAETIARIVALLRGERVDLTDVTVDMATIPEFERNVYVAAREIPPGATKTYGEIAKKIGHPTAAREVGVALARNPFAIVVPCHRVVAANGKTGGFSAGGGVKTKLRLLGIEGGAGPLFE